MPYLFDEIDAAHFGERCRDGAIEKHIARAGIALD